VLAHAADLGWPLFMPDADDVSRELLDWAVRAIKRVA